MQFETVAALVAPGVDAHGQRRALRATEGDTTRTYDYARLRTDAQKTGNLLSHQGVRGERRLGVVADPSPAPATVLALLGAALTGAVVRFDPPREFDGRAVLAPVDRADEYDLPPGGRRIAYGDAPSVPSVVHFEEEMWSENPTAPPPTAGPTDPLLVTDAGEVTHGEVVDAARAAVDDHEIDDDSAVAVRTPLARPETVAAAVAALLVGATVALSGDGDVTHAVASGSTAGEVERVEPPAV